MHRRLYLSWRYLHLLNGSIQYQVGEGFDQMKDVSGLSSAVRLDDLKGLF